MSRKLERTKFKQGIRMASQIATVRAFHFDLTFEIFVGDLKCRVKRAQKMCDLVHQ